jgi:hypothetical protein
VREKLLGGNHRRRTGHSRSWNYRLQSAENRIRLWHGSAESAWNGWPLTNKKRQREHACARISGISTWFERFTRLIPRWHFHIDTPTGGRLFTFPSLSQSSAQFLNFAESRECLDISLPSCTLFIVPAWHSNGSSTCHKERSDPDVHRRTSSSLNVTSQKGRLL